MPVPFCHLLLDTGWGQAEDRQPKIVPSALCVGSKCSAWSPDPLTRGERMGSCGLVHNAQRFEDPATEKPSPAASTEKP